MIPNESHIGTTVIGFHGTQKIRGTLLAYSQGRGFGIYQIHTEHGDNILVTRIELEKETA